MSDRQTRRRRVLATLGLAGTGTFSGCTGLFDDEPSDKTDTRTSNGGSEEDASSTVTQTGSSGSAPKITEVSVAPTPAQQTRTFTVTLTAANDGSASFSGELAVGYDDSVLHSEAVSIESGDTETISVEREALRVGEERFRAAVLQDDSVIDRDQVTVHVEQSPQSFVGVEGTSFVLDEGTFFVTGGQFNPSYMVRRGDVYTELQDHLFDGLNQVGGTVARFRAYTYDPELAPFPGDDNEAFFRQFDRAIVAAKRRDIRVVISMVGGAPSYALDPGKVQGNNVTTFVHRVESADALADFYVDENCIELYKEWVTELMTRENHLTGVEYRNDPTVMMWELGNEVEMAPDRDPEKHPENIRPWVEEVGPFVQDLAGEQLVTTGGVGWGCHGWEGGERDCSTEYRANLHEENKPESIDVCSVHWWPDPAHYGISTDVQRGVFDEMIAVAHDQLDKPLWFGEYNYAYPGEPGEIDDAFLEERANALRRWHDWMDNADVAGAAIHTIGMRAVNRMLHQDDDHRSDAEVLADGDDIVVEELRRCAARAREKSTASEVPPLPPLQ